MTLGIIGTAGRGQDGGLLTPAHWRTMVRVGQIVTKLLKPDRLVSGGAAYGDHVAVELYARDHVGALLLHLPAPFDRINKNYTAVSDAGHVSNRYHLAFEHTVGVNSLNAIAAVIASKNCVTIEEPSVIGLTSFFTRNKKVANNSDVMLAFTFGTKGNSELKDGGTSNTMATFLRRAKDNPELKAYHFNLTDENLYDLHV